MSKYLSSTSDVDFETDVLQSALPVLVDFWAEWCHPCKTIMPLVEAAAQEYQGRLKVCKVNVDENNATAVKYGVRGIPTLIIFKEGEVAATKVGALSQSQLKTFIEENL